MTSREPCPCGSKESYDACCEPIHEGITSAKTAEQLMRSRYSAFVKELEDYLLYSWHPDNRPQSVAFDANSKWLGLKIKLTKLGKASDHEGWVTFVARYKIAGKAERIEENSYFVRYKGRWVYHSAH